MEFLKLGMKNFVSSFIWICLFTSTQLFGTIIHAPNLDLIEKCISDLDENALVIFDIDYTIIVYNDRILAPCGQAYFQNFRNKLLALQEQGETLSSKIHLQSQVSLVDEKILNLLEMIKKRKIKTIALTAIPTGKFGVIRNTEEWRVNQLDSLGINFNWSFPSIDSIILTEFEGKKSQPIFKQGVLASASYPKGEVLCAFLRKIHLKPSKVIFIDDRMKYVDSVECELDKEHIRHISFHYTAATDRSCHLDEKLADFQFDHLMHHGDWLSDEEAKNQMNISDNPKNRE